jgi:predicted TIM-barrel fold metal-dependent hydrolase
MSKYAPAIDLQAIAAIDMHTHATLSSHQPRDPCSVLLDEHMQAYFKSAPPPSNEEIADYYRARRMAAVIFPVDAESELGHWRVPNEEVAELAARYNDVLIPFASIDPHKGKLGLREARRLIEDYGVRGFKFHPTAQGFYPNDRMAYPLYEMIAAAGLVALFHTGQTGVGAGAPGGMGLRLKYSNPMHLDDVAADFPALKIVMAHPSFPWQEEALAVATHKPGVYIDLSGWSPKYFPSILVRYANSILRHRVLFGSDFPAITPDRWIGDFDALPIKPEVRPLIMKDNAIRLLGLA